MKLQRVLRAYAAQSLAVLIACSGALAFAAVRAVAQLESEVNAALWRSEQRFRNLDVQVRFDSDRRRLLLGIRDAVLETRPEIGASRAQDLATLALEASEKFPRVDPLLLVAVGIVEGRYDIEATSPAGARGLYQIYLRPVASSPASSAGSSTRIRCATRQGARRWQPAI